MVAWVPNLQIEPRFEDVLRVICDDDAFVAAVKGVAENYAAMAKIYASTPTPSEQHAYLVETRETAQVLLKKLNEMPDQVRPYLFRFLDGEAEGDLTQRLRDLVTQLTCTKRALPKPKKGALPNVEKIFSARELSRVFNRFNLPWNAGQLRDNYTAEDVDGTHPATDALWVVFETARTVTNTKQISRKAAADFVKSTEQ